MGMLFDMVLMLMTAFNAVLLLLTNTSLGHDVAVVIVAGPQSTLS